MESLTAWLKSLPPAADFWSMTPEAYTAVTSIFQYFPVVALAQWLLPFHPQGKTSLSTRILNFPGRYAWCFMESIGAINLIRLLFFQSHASTGLAFFSLPLWNKALASLYVLHYLNRAFITPLFLAPSMSPIHAIIIGFAAVFNYMNSTSLAGWLLGYGVEPAGPGFEGSTAHTEQQQKGAGTEQVQTGTGAIAQAMLPYIPYIGLVFFLVGMYGNIRAENTLFRLRREEAHRRQNRATTSKSDPSDKDSNQRPTNVYSKVYVIPPASGYFRHVLFPHYSLEWLEWTGFMLMGFGVFTSTTRASLAAAGHSVASPSPPIPLAPYYLPLARVLLNRWGLSFPFPTIVFLVNSILNTAARASWGRKWYEERFGKEAVAGRAAVVPYIL
ncbi:hypothetical protein VTO42DRAFT_8748 [Malbranchea cinnamomea]